MNPHLLLEYPLGYITRPLFLLLLRQVQERMIFKPTRTEFGLLEPLLHPSGYKKFMLAGVEQVNIPTSDGLTLRSWYKAPAGPSRPVFLYLTGNTGHLGDCGPHRLPDGSRDDSNRHYRLRMVEALGDMGCGVLGLVYRGYGSNPGTPTEEGLVDDAEAAWEFLLQQGLKREQIIIVGDSLGGAVGIQLARSKGAHFIVTLNSFASVADKGHDLYPAMPAEQFIPYLKVHFDSEHAVRQLQAARLLIICGKEDETTYPYHSRKLYQAAQKGGISSRLVELDGVGHINYQPKQIVSLIAEAFSFEI